MSKQKPDDDAKVSMSFIFTQFTANEMQRWIDLGYFPDHSEIAGYAFGLVRKTMQILESHKKVIPVSDITLDIEVNYPEESFAPRVLQ